MRSDAELLDAWGAGEESAADELVERHFDALYRFFESTAPTHAEDLVQETLIACVEARASFRRESAFSTFVMGIARNKVLMFWRTQSRRPDAVPVAELSLEALGASPSQWVLEHQEQRLLLAGLRRLPLDEQILLQLHFWDGLTGPQLAEILGVPEGTVRSRLRRTRQNLEAAVTEAGASGAVLRSTCDNLSRWAASLKKS